MKLVIGWVLGSVLIVGCNAKFDSDGPKMPVSTVGNDTATPDAPASNGGPVKGKSFPEGFDEAMGNLYPGVRVYFWPSSPDQPEYIFTITDVSGGKIVAGTDYEGRPTTYDRRYLVTSGDWLVKLSELQEAKAKLGL